MDGGTDIIGHPAAENGRHSRRASADSWTPPVPCAAETTQPTVPKHAAGRAVPAQRGNRATSAAVSAIGDAAYPADDAAYPADDAAHPADDGVPGAAPSTPGDGARPGEESPFTQSGEPLLPNLAPGKHESRPDPAPVPVLAPVEYDRAPEPDPNTDTDSFGLRKFNLGSVPASVTPPRSWRKAAWFSVAASGAALAALVAMASTFVGHGGRTTIDALPGLPSAHVPTGQAPDGRGPHGRPGHASGERATTKSDHADSPAGKHRHPGRDSGGTERSGKHRMPAVANSGSESDTASGSAGPGAATGSAEPGTGATITASSPPPPQVRPETHTAEMKPFRGFSKKTMDAGEGNRVSQSFYDRVAEHPSAALRYADGSMTAGDRGTIKRRYADVDYVRVHRRSIDPNQRTTTNTMMLYYSDGHTRQVTRTLEFTSGDHPRIVRER